MRRELLKVLYMCGSLSFPINSTRKGRMARYEWRSEPPDLIVLVCHRGCEVTRSDTEQIVAELISEHKTPNSRAGLPP